MSQSWPSVLLTDICNPKQWPTISQSEMTTTGYPVYGANGKIGCYSDFNHEKPTLLVTCRGATCGSLNICEPFSYVTGNSMSLDDLDENRADQKYLYYALLSRGFKDSITGTAQPQITRQSLSPVSIPLPPLPEQKRIAAILDKADSIRRKRQEAVRLTEELLRSVFLDMFGDPVENVKKWPLLPIGTAIQAIETGWSANSDDRKRDNNEWAVLKISSVTSGRFLPDECKVVADEQFDRVLLTPKRGDLLFSRANTRELVAATCLVEQDEPKLFLPDKLWKIVPNKEITCTEYLRYLLAHPTFREKLTKQATGTSGSMLNISQAKVRGIEIPVPPIKLQKKFADFVWHSYKIRNKLQTCSDSSNTLYYSLIQSFLKGFI